MATRPRRILRFEICVFKSLAFAFCVSVYLRRTHRLGPIKGVVGYESAPAAASPTGGASPMGGTATFNHGVASNGQSSPLPSAKAANSKRERRNNKKN